MKKMASTLIKFTDDVNRERIESTAEADLIFKKRKED